MLVSDRVANALEAFRKEHFVPDHVWELSERERGIIRRLSADTATASSNG